MTALFALDIILKRGLENRKPYTVLHLRNDTPFVCKTFFDDAGRPSLYRCRFKRAPQERVSAIKSDFFTLRFTTRGRDFILEIRPLKKSLIFPMPPPLYQDPVLPARLPRRSSHWMVLGFTERAPYLGKEESFEEGLSFPIDAAKYALPAVGAIDLNGRPVFLKKNRDVEKFLAVKEAFEVGKFQKAYDLATEAMELYPRSIFASDFLYYRIKALFRLDPKENVDRIIKLGRLFLKRFSSDDHLPEVLLLLARVYSANGFVSDANYFFNRLIQEHDDTKYADLGRIYLGDQLYMNGATKEAIKNYLAAYYHATDLDVASLAAYKLAMRYLDMGKSKEAIGYLRKIWLKNPDFLLKNPADAHRLAVQLAALKAYDLAIAVEEALLKRAKKIGDLYQEALYNIGEWYDAKGEIKKAIKWYRRYLKEFPWGSYSDEVKHDLDALFVVDKEVNATEAMKRYDALMESYEGSPVAEKALAAKIALLVDQKRYKEALALKPAAEKLSDPDARKIAQKALKRAAEAYLDERIAEKDCGAALTVIREENLTVPKRYDPFIYRCDIEFADYADALRIVKRHLKEKSLDEKLQWSCRAVHALVGLQRYEEALKAAEEVLQLRKVLGKRGECDRFDLDYLEILDKLGRYAQEMAWIDELAKRYGDDMAMADVYKLGYEAAKRAKDPLQQLAMLQRLIRLQNTKGYHPYSPWAEFEAVKLLKSMQRYEEALKIVEGMEKLNLKGRKRARWLYEKGVLEKMTGHHEAAKKSFEACSRVADGGAWRKLCREALTLQNF